MRLLAGRRKKKKRENKENTIPSPFCTRITLLLAESRLGKDSATQMHIAQRGFNLTQTCPPWFSRNGDNCEIHMSPYAFPYPGKQNWLCTEKLGGFRQPKEQLQCPLGSRTFGAILIKLLSIRDKLECIEVNGQISINFKGLWNSL